MHQLVLLYRSKRPSSTTTRIKTKLLIFFVWFLLQVQDHRPLQQGLRRISIVSSLTESIVRDHRPLQQGLRL